MKYNLIAMLSCMIVLSCNQTTEKKASVAFVDPITANMDSTLNPGDDFFKYACGSWLKNNPIPDAEKSWGIWTMVQEETYNRIREISESAAKRNAADGSTEQKIGDFYAAGMDTININKVGYDPLKPELEKIASIKDLNSLQEVIALHQTYGVAPVFGSYIYQDEKNSDKQMLHLYQGGLGLPDRDYYFNTDARTTKIRNEYQKYIAKIFSLIGDDSTTSKANAATVIKFESGLAKASRKLEDTRDPYANYTKMAVANVKSLAPSIDWSKIFTDMHMRDLDTVIIGQPEFFKEVERNFKSTNLNDWKTYLRWQLIASFAPYMSRDFEQASFEFNGKILGGVKSQRPRWKRILDNEESAIGDLLGQLYVKKFVTADVKKRYQDLTNNIFEAYRDRINNLTWMSDSTKKLAIEKLNTVTTKVAYPNQWRDYSKLLITKNSYVTNILNANVWSFDYSVSKLGKPVDRNEWDMTPQTYNAYYNPSNNEIVLPAAIFIIPGLADTLADDAIIYGYAGASTIGHEITHGFDDQGRQFDAKGNLRNWWTKSDEEEFAKRAKLIVQQFDEFKVLDSLNVNGEATQGENIADLGGVVLGLEAFKKTEQYKSGKKINGLTPVQRYFLGYALSWLGHMRDETLAMRIMTDVHAPNFLRINGPVVNIDEFYEAFNIKPTDKIYRPDSLRVKIW